MRRPHLSDVGDFAFHVGLRAFVSRRLLEMSKVERKERAREAYKPSTIEPRWQARWEADELYRRDPSAPKPRYVLTMYPYPSGNLHIGHWFAYAPSDAGARFLRMRGNDVFFPFGFDAFGLPAENAAIQRGAHPRQWTHHNIAQMRTQLKSMGAMFDWSAEIITCEPEFYRWNQWFFLRFLETGLAYRKWAPVDWCPSCNTTLAREQVVGEDRECERCGTPVTKKELDQWFLGITRYAEELLRELDAVDWPERVKLMQRNWIGRSEGADIVFPGVGDGPAVRVFSTRPDTLFGASAIVLAPEHEAVDALTTDGHRQEVESYRRATRRRTEIDRLAADRDKTGVPTGGHVEHPLSGQHMPVWVADYVVPTYGYGAVMLVPAHDERDHAFASVFGLPTPVVVRPVDDRGVGEAGAYAGPGVLVDSGEFDGLVSFGKATRATWTADMAEEAQLPASVPLGQEAKEAIGAALAERERGGLAVTYRLRDWLISRQRYWGTPIPVVHCPSCGPVGIPDSELPVTLPDGVEFQPTGESPLKFATEWLSVTCPSCGGAAERDTDTMDTFVDSSWYQYRYLSPAYEGGPFDPAESRWLPVARYTGGIEHATMHLLYTRFWTKAMRDLGLVDFAEPMRSLFNQGIILGEDSEKMSKSRGNVVDPDALVALHGADAVRAYLMFIGPWQQGGPWDPRGIQGVVRFLHDVWDLALAEADSGGSTDADTRPLRRAAHQTVQRVTADMEASAYNTAIAALMELRNTLKDARSQFAGTDAWSEALDLLLLLLAPIAPHIAEELWTRRGRSYSIHTQPWPVADDDIAADDSVVIGIQVGGRLRDRVEVPSGAAESEVVAAALGSAAVQSAMGGADPRRIVYVPGRLVNIVM
jgi:leucyl-tRNA synthetase